MSSKPYRKLDKHRRRVVALRTRDGDRCWLCGLLLCFNVRVSKKIPAGSYIYITLDHVVPRSKGGTWDLTNLRLAHYQCNGLRGDKTAEPHPRWLADQAKRTAAATIDADNASERGGP